MWRLGIITIDLKKADRNLWKIGAGLLGIDIFKLLLVDLRGAATLTRVFAFLFVEGIFLLIGWIAPLPPRKEGFEDDSTNAHAVL